MANTFTPPTWIKAKPHASGEKQVGDSDPSARSDVINRPGKSLYAVLQRVINALTDTQTVDASDAATTTALPLTKMLTLAGKTLTEATTTSTSEVDLVTVSGLSIATTTPIRVIGAARKTSGAATAAQVRLRVNATTLTAGADIFSGTNQAEDGAFWFEVLPQEASNYTHAVMGQGMATGAATVYAIGQGSNAAPNATITSVVIRGFVNSASITLGVKNVFVFALPAN